MERQRQMEEDLKSLGEKEVVEEKLEKIKGDLVSSLNTINNLNTNVQDLKNELDKRGLPV